MNVNITWYSYTTLSCTVISFILSYFVYRNIKKGSHNVYYAVVLICMGIWCFDSYLITTFPYNQAAIYIGTICHLGGIYSSYFFILWVFGIGEHKEPVYRYYKVFGGATALLLTFLNIKPGLLIAAMDYNRFFLPFHGIGRYYYLFPMFLFINGIIGCLELKRKIALVSGVQRVQLTYILFAALVMYIAGTTYFMFALGMKVLPIADIFVILSNLVITFAIIRHRLMDIEVIIKKTLVFAGLFAAVYAVFAFFTFLGQLFFEKYITANRWVAMLPSVAIVTLMLRPLENLLLNVTNKFLFQKKFDYKELLKTYTSEVLTVLELDNLVNLTVSKLGDIIKLSSCAVLLFEENGQQFNVIASHNIKDPTVTLIRPNGIVTFMDQTHGYISVTELTKKNIEIPGIIQVILQKLNAELIIPLVLHSEIIGILSLGKKKSDEDFTQDDLDILLPLARTLAIAISNAQLFVQLGKTQAEAAQKEKMAVVGTLAAGMAHEIRNPITTIRIFSEYLPEKLGEPEFISKYKNIVMKEADKIDHIVQTMVDFSGDEAKDDLEDVSLGEAIDELLELISGQDDTADKIKFLKDIPSALQKIRVNRRELDEILLNLSQNAVHAMEERGTIIFKAIEDGTIVILWIEDTGCGMSEDVMKNIFSPFYTTRPKGFGLGLFVVNELMRRNGGNISVKSELGKGTSFKLEFKKA